MNVREREPGVNHAAHSGSRADSLLELDPSDVRTSTEMTSAGEFSGNQSLSLRSAEYSLGELPHATAKLGPTCRGSSRSKAGKEVRRFTEVANRCLYSIACLCASRGMFTCHQPSAGGGVMATYFEQAERGRRDVLGNCSS